jgi:putative chitinase
MFKFNREKFFHEYRAAFGPLTQSRVDAIEVLLQQIEQDAEWLNTDTHRHQLAYCFATFKWETAHTISPIDEYGSDDYFNSKYGPDTSVGQDLGNTEEGDGARFHGRGYVQLTGRSNYTKAGGILGIDLVGNPARAKEPAIAYRIAGEGMRQGWFTGKKLGQFIKDGAPPDYENARTIVNDHDHADDIADIAGRFDGIITRSLI